MDNLGSSPRMRYHDSNHYSPNSDQEGSWFGLAISGLKFLINNQSNNNINHNLNNSQAIASKFTSTQKQQNKMHILGPSVFKKQLYDIPEYQSMQIKSNDKCNLTKQALKRFNGNFSNYWNQRSSLHSHHSSNDDNYSNNSSHPTHTTATQPVADGAASSLTMPQQSDGYQPSMTSSQIIHPTQDKQKQPALRRSRSFPLLHSAKYIQNVEQLLSRSTHIMMDDNAQNVVANDNNEEEGSQCEHFASPPPISTTPELQHNLCLPSVHSVHALKSWESVKSINSSKSSTDGIVLVNNHFVKQRQWLPSQAKQMKSRKPSLATTAGTGSNSVGGHGSEVDWTDCNETIQVISRPLPKSMKKTKKRIDSVDNEEEVAFSDWSNVSSNIGVTYVAPK